MQDDEIQLIAKAVVKQLKDQGTMKAKVEEKIKPTNHARQRNLDQRRFNEGRPELPDFLRRSECVNFRVRPWLYKAVETILDQEEMKIADLFEKLMCEKYNLQPPKHVERAVKKLENQE